MKLLFDENLSPKLPQLVANQFPGSVHVRECGLKAKSDQSIWDYAGDNGFTLVSKDGDFYQRSLMGGPPKLIWLCMGNCDRNQLLNLILKHESDIRSFETAEESVLVIS